MNLLTGGMVPKVVEMLKESMERPYELSHEFAGSVTEDQSTDFWIACDNCGQWYHWDCVFVPQFQENAVCTRCEDALDLTTLVATCKQFFLSTLQ